MEIRRGDVFYADLNPTIGSEQGGIRPVLIVQNDVGNAYGRTVIVAPITSRIDKKAYPTHVRVGNQSWVRKTGSIIQCEQIRVLDKSRLRCKIGDTSTSTMEKVDEAIQISLGVSNLI